MINVLRGACSRTVACCIAAGLATSSARAAAPPIDNGFQGRSLVVVSDGDMQASAYEGSGLGPRSPDVLSVIRLDRPLVGARPALTPVSNSVIGPPVALALTKDGRYAIVAETRGPNTLGPDAKLASLPPGRILTVVDIHEPDSPRVVQRVVGRSNPLSVSIAPDGNRVLIAYAGDDGAPPLVSYRLTEGRLSQPQPISLPGFQPGDAVRGAAYSPSGAVAVLYQKRPRLSFVRFRPGTTILEPWGDAVPVGETPFETRFTPDGRFALVNDMSTAASGEDVDGHVTSVAIAAFVDGQGRPMHTVVSVARTGVMPEGLAVSPDGRWAATTNLERTAYPLHDPRQGGFATITLLRIEPQTGRLTRVADAAFNGLLPEGLQFDATSRRLAVLAYDHFAGRSAGGSVDIWRIGDDPQAHSHVVLVPTGLSVAVARGAQSLEIAR